MTDLCTTWLGHISINDRGWLVRQWAWRTRTGSGHLACRHRARSRGSSGQRLLLLQDQGRDWRGDRRAEAGAAVRAAAAMERSWIAQGSALRLRPRRLREQGFLGSSSAARSGRFAPSSTRRAARSPPERPRSSLNTWPGSRASFGHSGRGKTPTALPCTCFPPCKAFRSWLMPFMTPVLWRRRPSASRVGFKACETPGGLNPQAHTAKPEASRVKCALQLVSQLTYTRSDEVIG